MPAVFGDPGSRTRPIFCDSPRAAGPPTNTSYRSVGMACSRWSRIFVKNLTMFEVSGTDNGGLPLSFCTLTDHSPPILWVELVDSLCPPALQ